MLAPMAFTEGRAPHPKGGDPNVKMLELSLTPEEWRRLRAWAAEAGMSVPALVVEVLRHELARRPRRSFP
jgi:hypothetical protein